MLKRFAIIFFIVINICLLTGCYKDIDQQIMVSGIAVDPGEQGKKYHVSAETLIISGEEVTTDVIETDGDTVFEALRGLLSTSSKKLYFGHCKVMFISEKLARGGIGKVIDLLIREHEARINMDIIISKDCDAKDILMTEGVFSPIVSYKVDALFHTETKKVGDSPSVDAYKVYNGINSDGVSTVIAAFEIINVEDKKDIKLCGTGVFNKDKLVGYLDEKETKNLSLINNKLKKGLLTYNTEDGKDSFISNEIFNNKGKTEIKFKDDNITGVDISTQTEVSIGEMDTQADFTKTDEVKKISQKLESEMEKGFYKLIDKAQSKLSCDIFGIGRQIKMNYPELWEKYKENWDETFKTLDFNVDCKVKIVGSGIINRASIQ